MKLHSVLQNKYFFSFFRVVNVALDISQQHVLLNFLVQIGSKESVSIQIVISAMCQLIDLVTRVVPLVFMKVNQMAA